MTLEFSRRTQQNALAALLVILVDCSGRTGADDSIARAAIGCIESKNAPGASQLFHVPKTYSPDDVTSERRVIEQMLTAAFEQLGGIDDVRPGRRGTVLQVGIGSGDFTYWQQHPYVKTYVYDVQFEKANAGQLWIVVTSAGGSPEAREIKFCLPSMSPGAAVTIADLARRESAIVQSSRSQN